jgi:SAM-dependent methyltransferase
MSEPTIRGDFTRQAEFYARARPGYPAAVVERLLAEAGVAAGDPVVELGAGTGLFTAGLAGRGLRVTALEPNAAMREHAPELEGVRWASGTFEATGLAGGSQRWAVAAQAFHWADPARALPELRRVLAPGAPLSVLWNVRDVGRSKVLAWTMERIHAIAAGFDEGYRGADWSRVLASTGDFADPRTFEHAHVVRMSRERYLDLWRSHNHLNATAGPERVAALIEAVSEHLGRLGLDAVDVPYTCRAWTVRSAAAGT